MSWKKITHTGTGIQPHTHGTGPLHGESLTEEDGANKTLELGQEQEQDSPLYVEYVKDKEGETPVLFGGESYMPVWARYPDGKVDVGYYSQAGDVTYGHDALRKRHGV